MLRFYNALKKRYNKKIPIQMKASFWFVICSFLQRGISVITTPIFTRILSTSEFGKYNVFNSWFNIISVFISLNLFAGVYTQGLIKFDKERDVFSSSLQGLTLLMTIIWLFVYIFYYRFWNNIFDLTTVQMLLMLLMIWTTSAFSFWVAEQRVLLSYKKLVTVTLIVSFFKPVTGIILVVCSKDKVTARIIGLALVELISYTGFIISQMKRGRQLFSRKFWKYAIMYNLPLIPHYLSQIILNSADRIMINKIVGDSAAGIYSLAYSVAMIMLLFNTSVVNTMSPWMYQKIKFDKTEDIAGIAYVLLVVIAVVNILLIAFAPEIISIFAPKSYHDAIWTIPPIAMSVYFMFAYNLFAVFQFYYEKTKFVMLASVTAGILNIVLNNIFIKTYGYIAAGYTTLFCYITSTVGHYIFMKKILKEKFLDKNKIYDVKILLAITLSFVMFGFLIMYFYTIAIIRYFIIIIICLLILIFRRYIYDKLKCLIKYRT